MRVKITTTKLRKWPNKSIVRTQTTLRLICAAQLGRYVQKIQENTIAEQCMIYKVLDKSNQNEVTELFTSVFASSEGEEEGKLIGNLASKLSSNIDNIEIICFGAYENESLIGTIFFTRLRFNQSILVYMLAPVAVSTKHQGKGAGQALINYGLSELKKRSVNVTITYGDPSFYSRVGFVALSENVIQAPLKLSMPEGWQGQSMTEEPIPNINERPACVEEFNDPGYW
jgi:predicted N-acetyltransferase YhbS